MDLHGFHVVSCEGLGNGLERAGQQWAGGLVARVHLCGAISSRIPSTKRHAGTNDRTSCYKQKRCVISSHWCRYCVNFTVDIVVGFGLCLGLLRLSEHLAQTTGCETLAHSGDYGHGLAASASQDREALPLRDSQEETNLHQHRVAPPLSIQESFRNPCP